MGGFWRDGFDGIWVESLGDPVSKVRSKQHMPLFGVLFFLVFVFLHPLGTVCPKGYARMLCTTP